MPSSNGIDSIKSLHPVDVTLRRLKEMIGQKGLTLFAHIDHTEGARQVGLEMQPAHVLIFGNAKAGTPLMIASPLLALDLPLKVLVWQDAEGKTQVSYNTPEFIGQRHHLAPELLKNISGIKPLIEAALA